MSREIKVRAWDEDCEVMYYSDKEHEDCRFGFHEGRVVAWLRETEPQTLDEPTYDYGKLVEVEELIGRKDKDGVEIYEGDICKIHIFTQELGENMGVMEGEREFVAEIRFDCVCGLSVKNDKGDSGPLYMYNGFEDSEEQIEVIGNIHQSPGLLK